MSFTIYESSVPVFQQMLKNVSAMLIKAEAHAAEKGVAINELLSSRLHPEMFDFTRQIQNACDHAKGASARLAGVDVPSFADTETTVAELQARVQKTLDFVSGLPKDNFTGAEDRDIKLVFPWATYDFKGGRYLTYWALPNFFFHITTAYDILRQQGVNLGKADFIGR